MYPSCSQYARQAMDKHGEIIGWMMACDRLLRCGRDEMHRQPKIWVKGQLKCYDPVADNDFWWHPKTPAAIIFPSVPVDPSGQNPVRRKISRD
jgi:hypothetical protein